MVAGGNFDVIILGGGPAGLTASYLLTKEGLRTEVIEQDPVYLGGISRTINYKKFLFDIGGHRFFSKSKEVVGLWKEILPDDFITRPRMSRIYYKGKYYSYPLKAFEALTNLGIMESAQCVLSYAVSKLAPVKSPRTFHEWVANHFGERLFRIFFKTYTEKVWGMSCDDISADWAAQRIKGLNLWEAVVNSIWNSVAAGIGWNPRKNPTKVKSLIESFEYPRLGPGMMWETAGQRIRAQGGTISMGCEFVELSQDPSTGLFRVSKRAADGTISVTTAPNVISTVPIQRLVASMNPAPSCCSAATALKYRDFITVALVVRKPELFPDNWLYIHDPDVKVGRIQNFRSWSPDMVPDAAFSCLGMEYFCFEGDDLWARSDEELIALAAQEIGQIGICEPEDVVDGCVIRQEKAYPVYDETYKANVKTVRVELQEKYPSLQLVGRNGMHKYNNQDHSMMTAMLAVRNIIAGKIAFDVWNVNEDAEYHETATAIDQPALGSLRLVPQKASAAGVCRDGK